MSSEDQDRQLAEAQRDARQELGLKHAEREALKNDLRKIEQRARAARERLEVDPTVVVPAREVWRLRWPWWD